MSIINEQLKMSEVFVTDGKADAEQLGLASSVLINFPRVEESRSGYYSEYQYPDNQKGMYTFVAVSEGGFEQINESKTSGGLGVEDTTSFNQPDALPSAAVVTAAGQQVAYGG